MKHVPIPAADARLRLCWLRETSLGHLDCHFSLPASAESLRKTLLSLAAGVPENIVTALADHMLAITDPARTTELHLPYLDRNDWFHRDEILARTGFRLHGSVLLPSALSTPELLNRYYARLLSAAAFQPCAEATISAPPLSMPAGLFAAWRMAPSEKHADYLHGHFPATRTLQQLLRDVVVGRWLANPANWECVRETCAVFAYATSAPFTAGSRIEFTHDVMKPYWLRSALRGARRPLSFLLRSFRLRLLNAGRPDLVEQYAPLTVRKILRDRCIGQGTLKRYVALEGRIANLLLNFGAKIRTADNPIALAQDTVSFVTALDQRLARFNAGSLADIIPLILVTTTRALASARIPARLAA